MKIQLHPSAAEAYDKEAEQLLQKVIERPVSIPTPKPGQFIPESDIAAVISSDDMVGEFFSSRILPTGEMTAKFVHRQDNEIGLEAEGYQSLRLFVEKIQRQHAFQSCVSTKTLEEYAFIWLVDRHSSNTDQTFLGYVLPKVEEQILLWDVWVPIFGIHTPFSFQLGRTTIYPIGKQFFDTWGQVLATHPHQDTPEMRAVIAMFRRKLQGGAACTIKLEAERRRAEEMAMEEAENALSMLRIFLPTNFHPNVPSYCRSYGRERIESDLIISIYGTAPPVWFEGISSDFQPTILDQELMDVISAGLGSLHSLYLVEKKTEFQETLLSSVLTYSQSSLQTRPSDRLIYAFSALDSFLLENANESIQANIADRIAFTISGEAKERMEIVKTITAAYGMRSQAVHHNQSIKDVETIVKFLAVAFRFYTHLIIHNGEYKTRQDFFDSVRQKRYS